MNRDEMEEVKRHFGVVAEGLERKIQLAAEGVVGLHVKLDREMGTLRGELIDNCGASHPAFRLTGKRPKESLPLA